MPYTHLLVVCDGSPQADEAVVAASKLARRDHAQLTVAAVAELERPSRGCGLRTDVWNDVLRDAASDDLARAAKVVESPARFTLLCGHEGPVIADYARELGCDAIVLPSPPRSWLRRVFYRDQAATVRRLAPCAVIQQRPR
jgi:nucleotide-binding universal stress UspA family protein